jgi:hypothetical protein
MSTSLKTMDDGTARARRVWETPVVSAVTVRHAARTSSLATQSSRSSSLISAHPGRAIPVYIAANKSYPGAEGQKAGYKEEKGGVDLEQRKPARY